MNGRACRCGCGKPVHARGLAGACYHRWLYRGKPEVVPPPGQKGNDGKRQDRLEDFAELRQWGESLAAAAMRLGVCRRTAERYEADLRSAAS